MGTLAKNKYAKGSQSQDWALGNARRKFVAISLFAQILFIVSCVKSPGGSVSELVVTDPPRFAGSTNQNYTTATAAFLLVGTCDPASYGLEYSLDQISWTTIAGGCAGGGFNINVNLLSGIINVYARAVTKFAYSTVSVARIRLLLPATSESFAFVSAGNDGEPFTANTQYALESTMTLSTLIGGVYNIQQSLVDVMYGP
jgi:hypothetical protein